MTVLPEQVSPKVFSTEPMCHNRLREIASPSGSIRRIDFETDSLQVAHLLSRSFQLSVANQGISLNGYIRLAQKRYIRLFHDLFHASLSRSVEAFVWVKGGNLLGVGIVQRLPSGDGNRWLLSAFAVDKGKAFNLEAVVKMRSLMRQAIGHARRNGASQVQAYVRRDNKGPYLLCTKEGFHYSAEYSGFGLSRPQIHQIKNELISAKETASIKVKVRPSHPLVWLARGVFLGYRKSIFGVWLDRNHLAEITVSIYRKPSSACQVEIEPTVPLNSETGRTLFAVALQIICRTRIQALVIFPTSCRPLLETMRRNGIQKTLERDLLVLNLA